MLVSQVSQVLLTYVNVCLFGMLNELYVYVCLFWDRNRGTTRKQTRQYGLWTGVSTRRLNCGVSTRRYDLEFCKSGSAIPNMTYSTRNFDPISPQIPKFCNTNIAFLLETHCCRRHTCTCATTFYTTWVRGVACQKQRLGPKLEGAALEEHPKNLGPPYVFLQPLKLATSNLVHDLGLGLAYQKKTTFRAKIGGGLGQGSNRKKMGPPTYFCNRWSSNFKFGTQPGYFVISNCVFNFNFLALVLYEILGSPKFTLGALRPPEAPERKNVDTRTSTRLHQYNGKFSAS